MESIVLLSHKSPDSHIDVKVEFGEGEEKVPLDKIAERAKQYQPAPRVTYKMIQEYSDEITFNLISSKQNYVGDFSSRKRTDVFYRAISVNGARYAEKTGRISFAC